jgi:hypothetical protein
MIKIKLQINKILRVILIGLLVVSCNKNDKSYSEKDISFYEKESFRNKKDLTHIKTDENSDSIFQPSYIEIVNNYLILLDRKSKKPFHLVDLITEKYLGSFIKKGQGPNEVHVPWTISKIDNESFLAYDVAGKKILGLHIDSLLNGRKPIFEKKINEKGFCSSIQIVNDDIYYTSDLNSTNRLFKINSLTGKEEAFGTLLKNYKNISDINFGQACRAIMSYNNDNNKFVVAYKLAPFFEIYNLKNNEQKSILTIDNFSPIYREVDSEGYTRFATTKETRLGIINISLSKNYIYLLYSGEKMHDHIMDVGNKIMVFDYGGNPVTFYQLDKNLSSFAVYNDSIIYGIHNDIKAELIKFNINQ